MNTTIINITFNISGHVQLDLDRAKEDCWWDHYNKDKDLNDPIQLQQACADYISAYLRNEELLSNAPFTCGPASIYHIAIEVKNGGRNNAETDAASSPNQFGEKRSL